MEAVMSSLAAAYIQQSARRHLTRDAKFNNNVLGNSNIRELNILPLGIRVLSCKNLSRTQKVKYFVFLQHILFSG